MAKRKKDEVDSREELPKRIKGYLATRSSSKPNPNPVLPESERIVDEILNSPALVSKVRKILKKSHRNQTSSSSSSR